MIESREEEKIYIPKVNESKYGRVKLADKYLSLEFFPYSNYIL